MGLKRLQESVKLYLFFFFFEGEIVFISFVDLFNILLFSLITDFSIVS